MAKSTKKSVAKSKEITAVIVEKPVAISGTTPAPVKKPKAVWPKRLAFTLVLVAALGGAVFFYLKYQDAKNKANMSQEEKLQSESTSVLERLKKVILITEAETPTVARAEDIAKLKSSNPEFYKDIQQGDYVIIFPKRAIIFRSSSNQIINIAFFVDTTDATSTPTADTPPQQ